MFPIMKIRLTYIKRNFFKNILSFSYPIIIIYLFMLFLENIDKLDLLNGTETNFFKRRLKSYLETEKHVNEDKKNINEPHRHRSNNFDIFDDSSIKFIRDGQIGIISENEEILKRFNIFSIEHFCINTEELDPYGNLLDELFKSFNISEKYKKKIPSLSSLSCKVKLFKNKEEFNKYLYSMEYKNDTEFKLVFEINKDKNDIINFNIMTTQINLKSVDKSKNLLTLDNPSGNSEILSMIGNPSKDEYYYQNYFLIISNFLKQYYIGENNENSNSTEEINIYYKPLNTPPIYNKLSNEFTISFFPISICISFSSTLFTFVLWMVKEKSQNLHEFLFRYGITPNRYYQSWFLIFMSLTLLPIIICTFIIWKKAFVNISPIYIFFSLLLFDISLFSSSLLIHTLTKTTEQSQTLLKLIYIFLTFLSSMITKPEVNYFTKKIFSIFPQIILIQNFQELIMLDNFKTNSFFIDYQLLKTPYNKISLLESFISYFVIFFIHLFIANIILSYQNFYTSEKNKNNCENINFILFLKNFFKCKNLLRFNFGYMNLEEVASKNDLLNNINFVDDSINEKTEYQNGTKSYHEILNEHQFNLLKSRDCLSINNISKSFSDVKAVNNFNGSLFPSEIFCLLGHNGAGKTTLIKIISGMEKPDSGDIILFGNSILKNKKFLYKNIGVCDQENNFFDYLTVYEHLKFFSEIKQNVYFLNQNGINEIKTLIQKLGLEEKKNSLSKTLSGGQKRKLCIAMALAGNSKLVLLDEPTSGMDVLAKRELWNFFKSYKNDKIIILTTHSLEEAEYLGDRIGIMLDGKYVCSGTGSYLKNKYPCGYNINFLMANNYMNRNELLEDLKEIDDSAVIKVASKNILSINFMSMLKKNIDLIFDKIEKNNFKEKYGIVNYTISSTSLEDVFLKLNNDEMSKIMFNTNKFLKKDNELMSTSANNSSNVIIVDSNNNNNNNRNEVNNINNSCGIKKFCSELKGGLKRNLIPIWRNKCNFFMEVLSASLTIIIYLLGINSIFWRGDKNGNNLMKLYDGLPIYFSSNFDNSDKKQFFNIYDNDNEILKKYPFIKIKKIDYPKDIKEINIDKMSDYFYKISKYKNERNFLVVQKNEKNNLEIYVLYQTTSRDYFPASLNYILSILFQQKYKIKTYFINTVNTISLGSKPDKLKDFEDFTLIFYSIIMLWNSFVSLSGYMINTPLKERIKNIKHLLKLSGASMFTYWLSLLIVDIIKYIIFIITVLPLLAHYDKIHLYNTIMLLPFLLALNMFVYMFSFIVDSEIHSQKFFLLSVYILSFGLPILSIIKNEGNIIYIMSDDKFVYTLNDIFPFSSFLIAMFRLFYNSSIKKIGFIFGNKQLGFIIYNHSILFLFQFIFYLFLLYLFEIRFFERVYICISNLLCFRRIYSNEINYNNNMNNTNNINSDSLSNNLYSRLDTIQRDNNNITTKIKNLYKTYFVCRGKNVRAVNNLNLNLEKNEHFGLVGFNGSGKTTTFKSITREIFFDRGTIELFGYNVSKSKDFSKLTNIIGYCPQENALFDYLTVEEVLNYFRQLKINQITESDDLDNNDINKIYDKFGLSKYRNKMTTNLSGGNKRKLNFAIALMNNPKIILLDEPSTGVDPESRRLMWINLLSLQREYNMILSTHSMEEAEVLSDRVGWMKEGSFAVEGIPEELKIKFSSGYYLFIKFISMKELNKAKNNIITDDISDIDTIKSYFNKIIKDEKEIKMLFGEDNNEFYISENDNLLVMNKLNEMFKIIEGKYKDVNVIERGIDNNSFKFLFHVEQQNQGDMFKTILNIKSNMEEVSEININIESLENIFTKFQ